MQSASDELRHFAEQRSGVFLELAACSTMAGALWVIAGRLEGVLPEVHFSFLVALLLFAVGFVRLVVQVIPVLTFRCPRCDHLFHADRARAALRLNACAHCDLAVVHVDADAAVRLRAERKGDC